MKGYILVNHSVDELCKKAHPALRHEQLVQIAQTETPSGAYRQAIHIGFPNRQADATRFLAILRRDHLEAFKRLTTQQSTLTQQ